MSRDEHEIGGQLGDQLGRLRGVTPGGRRGRRRSAAEGGFDRSLEHRLRHHPGGGPGGPGGGPWGEGPWDGGRGHRGGPPPWLAGFFGVGERGRGPRVRRGDVRTAILDVLREAEGEGQNAEINGYQVIQRIAERSGDAWRPSPGSVYPTIQQLEDEGLVAGDAGGGRRSLALTDAGRAWVADNAEQLDAVWAPFAEDAPEDARTADLKPELGRLMSAVWQVKATGTEAQQQAALELIVETRRRLYGILADADLE